MIMDTNEEMTMSVSPICRGEDGKKFAYVSFEGRGRRAEGVIPACHIRSADHFSPQEIDALEVYMRENLKTLKQMAADIDIMDAFLNNSKSTR